MSGSKHMEIIVHDARIDGASEGRDIFVTGISCGDPANGCPFIGFGVREHNEAKLLPLMYAIPKASASYQESPDGTPRFIVTDVAIKLLRAGLAAMIHNDEGN